MTDGSRKGISIACLCFVILWFAAMTVFEAHYVIGVFHHQPTFRDVLGAIYEEQIEGINFVLVLIYLIPGVFAWAVYRRFRRSY